MKRNFQFIKPHREHRSEKNRSHQAGDLIVKTFKRKVEKVKIEELEDEEIDYQNHTTQETAL